MVEPLLGLIDSEDETMPTFLLLDANLMINKYHGPIDDPDKISPGLLAGWAQMEYERSYYLKTYDIVSNLSPESLLE